MLFAKGIATIGERQKEATNKLTRIFRETVLLAYENIGGHDVSSR